MSPQSLSRQRRECDIDKLGSKYVDQDRELARQIHAVLTSVLKFHPPSAQASGHDADAEADSQEPAQAPSIDPHISSKTPLILPQLLIAGQATTPKDDLRHFLSTSPNILIATPGRLLELLSSPHVHCTQSTFEILILDEADRLLDMGFKTDLQKIIAKLPKQRRTGLFSATVGEAVDQIVRVGLRNPVKIAVKVRSKDGREDQNTPASLQMRYMVTKASEKWTSIFSVLSSLDPLPAKSIIYVSTCAAVDYWQHVLPSLLPIRSSNNGETKTKFQLIPLHGKQPQKHRQKNLARFADTTTSPTSPSILLTTDVAARGLDIPQVDLVLQYDPPTDPKNFLHRCGRAGRAGRKGLSILLVQPGREAEDYISFLEIRGTVLTPLSSGMRGSLSRPHPEARSAQSNSCKRKMEEAWCLR